VPTRRIGHTVHRSIIRIVAVAMIMLTLDGCEKSEPTATSLPATATQIASTTQGDEFRDLLVGFLEDLLGE
jgi:hypothetical protein